MCEAFVQIIFDNCGVECIGLFENTILTLLITAVLQVVFHGIICSIVCEITNHLFRNRNVNRCPNVIRRTNIIPLFRHSKNTLLEGLVLPRAHWLPTAGFDLVVAFDDGIILNALTRFIDRNLPFIQWNVDRVSICIPR